MLAQADQDVASPHSRQIGGAPGPHIGEQHSLFTVGRSAVVGNGPERCPEAASIPKWRRGPDLTVSKPLLAGSSVLNDLGNNLSGACRARGVDPLGQIARFVIVEVGAGEEVQ